MLGEIEPDLAEILHLDVTGILSRNTMFGFPNENWKEFKTNWDQVLLVPGNFNTCKDPNGDLVIFPEGDVTVQPSGKMPKNGYFFDSIIRQNPIIEENLNPDDNMEEFNLLQDADIQYWTNQVSLEKDSGKGLMVNFGGTALGDIALVPAPFLKNSKGIRDVTEWYMSTLVRPGYVKYIFEK